MSDGENADSDELQCSSSDPNEEFLEKLSECLQERKYVTNEELTSLINQCHNCTYKDRLLEAFDSYPREQRFDTSALFERMGKFFDDSSHNALKDFFHECEIHGTVSAVAGRCLCVNVQDGILVEEKWHDVMQQRDMYIIPTERCDEDGSTNIETFEDVYYFIEENKDTLLGVFLVLILHGVSKESNDDYRTKIVFRDGQSADPAILKGIQLKEGVITIVLNTCQTSPEHIDKMTSDFDEGVLEACCHSDSETSGIHIAWGSGPLQFCNAWMEILASKEKFAQPFNENANHIQQELTGIRSGSRILETIKSGLGPGSLGLLHGTNGKIRINMVLLEKILPTWSLLLNQPNLKTFSSEFIRSCLRDRMFHFVGTTYRNGIKIWLVGETTNPRYSENIFAIFYLEDTVWGLMTNIQIQKMQEEEREIWFTKFVKSPPRISGLVQKLENNEINTYSDVLCSLEDSDSSTEYENDQESILHRHYNVYQPGRFGRLISQNDKTHRYDLAKKDFFGHNLPTRLTLCIPHGEKVCRVNEHIDYKSLKWITEKLLERGVDLGLDERVVFGNNKSFSSLAKVVEDANLQSFVNKDVWALLSNHDVEEEEEVQAADEPAHSHSRSSIPSIGRNPDHDGGGKPVAKKPKSICIIM